jgi:hypothetical protein
MGPQRFFKRNKQFVKRGRQCNVFELYLAILKPLWSGYDTVDIPPARLLFIFSGIRWMAAWHGDDDDAFIPDRD